MEREKLQILINNKIPDDAIPEILAGGSYYEHMLGVRLNDYWLTEKFTNRDEFYVVLNSYFALIGAIKSIPYNNEWRLKFDVAFLFQLKSNAQFATSIDSLTKKHCYADALSICRTMLSRLNFLIICALNPNLFDVWLKNPKDERFLDGHVRDELKHNGILIPSHLYESYSEVIHNQAQGLFEIGYFEKGLFPELPPIDNQIWVISKFLIGMNYYTMICMALKDCEGKQIPERLKIHQELFNWIQNNYLVANRIDQIWTFLAVDRHVEKVGKDKYIIGGSFDFNGLKEQIDKFYKKGQRKKLSRKYDI